MKLFVGVESPLFSPFGRGVRGCLDKGEKGKKIEDSLILVGRCWLTSCDLNPLEKKGIWMGLSMDPL